LCYLYSTRDFVPCERTVFDIVLCRFEICLVGYGSKLEAYLEFYFGKYFERSALFHIHKENSEMLEDPGKVESSNTP
jgi:hypothetical protein